MLHPCLCSGVLRWKPGQVSRASADVSRAGAGGTTSARATSCLHTRLLFCCSPRLQSPQRLVAARPEWVRGPPPVCSTLDLRRRRRQTTTRTCARAATTTRHCSRTESSALPHIWALAWEGNASRSCDSCGLSVVQVGGRRARACRFSHGCCTQHAHAHGVWDAAIECRTSPAAWRAGPCWASSPPKTKSARASVRSH